MGAATRQWVLVLARESTRRRRSLKRRFFGEITQQPSRWRVCQQTPLLSMTTTHEIRSSYEAGQLGEEYGSERDAPARSIYYETDAPSTTLAMSPRSILRAGCASKIRWVRPLPSLSRYSLCYHLEAWLGQSPTARINRAPPLI
jgi:hypothetical protein